MIHTMPYDHQKMANQDLKVIANRGKYYRVAFDDVGNPYVVQVAFRGSWRRVWSKRSEKNSLTASCAIHAAVNQLKAWR
jgi:nitroimidazol reductase NimA-like FMN-containing flavoprotein (pyridoxamine 5'-phosphate oxidase superfamily)